MAEAFGIVVGSLGITGAFTACVQCFGYLQAGRHFGEDYAQAQAMIDITGLRISRWGESVKIFDDPGLSKFNATPHQITALETALAQILAIFQNSQQISKRYGLVAEERGFQPTNEASQIAFARLKGNSVLNLTRWALKDKQHLDSLISSLIGFIEAIEKLFPPPEVALLARQEAEAISDNNKLRLIASIDKNVDRLLQNAAREQSTIGVRFNNVTVLGLSQVGNQYSPDWSGTGVLGVPTTYDRVEAGKDAKALIGNTFGGKMFWDDK